MARAGLGAGRHVVPVFAPLLAAAAGTGAAAGSGLSPAGTGTDPDPTMAPRDYAAEKGAGGLGGTGPDRLREPAGPP